MVKYFFNMSEALALGFNVILLIASKGKNIRSSTADLSEEMKVSHNHLSKVLQKLVNQGILSAKRGPHGGYTIGKSLKKVKLVEVFNVFDKQGSPHTPVPEKLCIRQCCEDVNGTLTPLLNKITEDTRKYLLHTSMDDVLWSSGK